MLTEPQLLSYCADRRPYVALACPNIYIYVCRLVVIDDWPCWHVHPVQVAAGEWFLSLLDHRYPRLKMSEHEIFPQHSCIVCYLRADRYWAPYQLEYPGEGHHIGCRSLHFLVDPPLMGDVDVKLACHVLFERRLCHRHSALGAS